MFDIERLGWVLNVFFMFTFIMLQYGVGGSVSTPIFVKISQGGYTDQY